MRVASVAYLHGNGGAERQIVMLSNYLAKIGHEVHIVILNENKSYYPIDESVIQHDLTHKEHGMFRIIHRWRALIHELKKIHPDITINFNYQSAYFEALVPRSVCGKIIYSERGDPFDSEYSGILGIVRSITLNKIDGFVFQSEGARDYFCKEIRDRSLVIHNPISILSGKYSLPEKRDNRIVNVGRLHPQKNQTLLIKAFSKVHQLYPEYILEIYGDGALRDNLENLAHEIGIDDVVRIYPSTKDVFDRIRTASLFAFTSDYEGMPNALMEAMALGLPCVSTDCRPGGARSLIDDGVNGILVPVRNEKKLVEMIIFVLANKNIADKLSSNAISITDTHSPDEIYRKWEKYLLSLIK